MSYTDELYNLNDLEGGNKRDKLFFPENIPVKMKIVETTDGILTESGYNYYVFRCKVLDGEHEGKDYDVFVNTKYKNGKGEEKGTYTFKKVLGGLAKGFATLEIQEGRGNDLPETFKTQLDRTIGKDIEVAFFKPDRGYQNLIYVRDLTKQETTTDADGNKKQEDF